MDSTEVVHTPSKEVHVTYQKVTASVIVTLSIPLTIHKVNLLDKKLTLFNLKQIIVYRKTQIAK